MSKSRLNEKYEKEVAPALKSNRKYTNVHQIPKLQKIVVHMGVSASLEKGAIDDAARDLTAITGRKPVIAKSRPSVAMSLCAKTRCTNFSIAWLLLPCPVFVTSVAFRRARSMVVATI